MTKKVKYHINPKTGRPNQCTATVKDCQFSNNGMIPEHYDTVEEARVAYEQQNKENTFGNTVKKTSIITNIDNKDIAEVLKHTIRNSPVSIKNVSYTTDIKEYALEVLQAKNLKEIRKRIEKDKIALENSPRFTKEEYMDYIIAEKLNKHADAVVVRTYEEQNKDHGTKDVYYANVDRDHLHLESNTAQPTYENPLTIPAKDQYYFNEPAYNDYNDENTSMNYEYKIENKDLKKLHNNDKYEVLKSYESVMNDKSVPDWMILPEQSNSHNEKFQNHKPDMIAVRINVRELTVQTKQRSKTTLKNAEKKLATEKEKLSIVEDAMNKAIKNNESKIIIDTLKNGVEKQKTTIKKDEKRINILNNDVKDIYDKKKELTELKKELYTTNYEMFKKDIASRYPSTDPVERENAAQQWIKENKDNLPDMNTYHTYREDKLNLY